jgi:hypothetical protein
MREYTNTDKNVRSFKAIPTEAERTLYLDLQRAVRDAALKVLDKYEGKAVGQVTITPTYEIDGETYVPDLIQARLVKQEGDTYPGSLDLRLALRIPGQDNPNFDPEKDREYA